VQDLANEELQGSLASEALALLSSSAHTTQDLGSQRMGHSPVAIYNFFLFNTLEKSLAFFPLRVSVLYLKVFQIRIQSDPVIFTRSGSLTSKSTYHRNVMCPKLSYK